MEGYAATSVDGAFARSRERFESVVTVLSAPEAGQCTHAELEEQLTAYGRELMCSLLQDHLDLRAAREVRQESVTGTDGVQRRSVETGHERVVATVFGEVTVEPMAYRARGAANLHPADALLNLPATRHSHGLRHLAALESVRGSFEAAGEAIGRICGKALGKRQVEELTRAAAVDTDAFYTARRPGPSPEGEVLVLSVDAKGIVMRPEALRQATRRAAAAGGRKLVTRLSGGEKLGRKRMAEVGAVYDATLIPREVDDIITTDQDRAKTPGPLARGKWLLASVEHDATEVIEAVFDEAERRDPIHQRCWIALVDGNTHQITTIKAEARRRGVDVHIVVDFVHVGEYLWRAAWCFFAEGAKLAEAWVAEHARRILAGRSSVVAAAIRRKATCRGLVPDKRERVEVCVRYLLNKGRYLKYGLALERGWPIATGVIEGACRHLVKDRMDITGARWGLAGAEAVLKLRAVVSNGDFDAYWAYHLRAEHRRVHGVRYRNDHELAA